MLGTVDVFELRPRIGITSAALAERIPRPERVHDVVVSASYGVVGRWREAYDDLDHERAVQLLTEVGALHLADRTFGTLSEGERKRVQIARALMADPELLLLDEPAAGLDLGGREDLVSTLSVLAADPASPATVLVSHHVEEIPPGFTHALLLRARSGRRGRPDRGGRDRRRPVGDLRRCRSCSTTRTVGGTRGGAPAIAEVAAPSGSGQSMDWLSDNAWAAWLSAACSSGCAELVSLDLVLAMLAVGALVGMRRLGRRCRPRPADPARRRQRRSRCSPWSAPRWSRDCTAVPTSRSATASSSASAGPSPSG